MGKVAVAIPPGTLTVAGTVARVVLELLSVTVAPLVIARPSRVTIPSTEVFDPPTTVPGVMVTELRLAA